MIKMLPTYDRAFQALWLFCFKEEGKPLSMSIEEVASWILRFSQVQPHTARNAFSGLLHVPGWEYLKFSPCIKQAKRFWNVSGPKYADFWDAEKNPHKIVQVAFVYERCRPSKG